MEENRDPRREGAMETLRAIDQATERIDALIARAGGPMVICKNVQESDADRRESRMQMLYDVADYRYDGDLLAYPVVLADMIDRLEAALHNTLNERDQLLADLNRMTNKHGSCDYCLHKNKSAAECRGCTRENDHWEWRGVPEVNDNDA